MLPLAILIVLSFALSYNIGMYKLLNAEEVLDLMLNHCSLSRYDQKFFYNLQLLNVLTRKPITSNQAALFTKVVKKYKKQLALHKLDANQLAELPWTLKVIPTSPEFTHAHFSIEGDQLILRCPFKQAFVQEFRDHSIMVWNRDERYYNTEFGLYKLKIAFQCVIKHYDDIQFCPAVHDIITQIYSFDENKCWEPTLTSCNGRLYIFNLNEQLEKAIQDIELNTELSTLALICSFGISVSESLKHELLKVYSLEDLNFAIYRDSLHEVTDVEGLASKLNRINCDYALHSSTMYATKDNYQYDKILSEFVNFPIETTNKHRISMTNKKYKMPVLIKSMSSYTFAGPASYHAAKIINLVNSNPIELK